MRSVELFAGAGGLAIGMSNAGFHHAAVIEWDHQAHSFLSTDETRVDERRYSCWRIFLLTILYPSGSLKWNRLHT